jgi:hypothetical protein
MIILVSVYIHLCMIMKRPNDKARFSCREHLYCHFRAEIARIGIHLTLNRSALLVFLTKMFFKQVLKFSKTGRFVSWTF